MAIRFSFFCIVVKKSAVRKLYAGGESQFRSDYPSVGEDKHLFNIGSMSGGEFDEITEALEKSGLDSNTSFALGEGGSGEIKPCPGIHFQKVSAEFFPIWEARLIFDDQETMAAEGAILYEQILKRGWTLDIPESG